MMLARKVQPRSTMGVASSNSFAFKAKDARADLKARDVQISWKFLYYELRFHNTFSNNTEY